MSWENRWRLFGHILRRDREIPANKAMEGFFVSQADKFRGRPITTLPVVLNKDLSSLESCTYCLKTFKHIENLKKIAEQRDQWRILCTRIQKAAEALQSDDYDAERRKVKSSLSSLSLPSSLSLSLPPLSQSPVLPFVGSSTYSILAGVCCQTIFPGPTSPSLSVSPSSFP